MTDGEPLKINGSNGTMVNGQPRQIWTACWGQTWLYSTNETSYAVGNSTDHELPMETVGAGINNTPTTLWTNRNELSVYHSQALNTDDSTGNYDAADAGDPSIINGRAAKGIAYDGVGDYENIGNLGTRAAATISGWYKSDTNHGSSGNARWQTVIGQTAQAFGHMHLTTRYIDATHFKIEATIADSSPGAHSSANTSLQINNWYHFVFAYDNSTANSTLYINGYLDSSQTKAAAHAAILTTSRIGDTLSGRLMKGILDEVRVYASKRTTTQVQQEYQNMIGTSGYGTLGATEFQSLNFTITTIDEFNSNAINNFSATIDGTNYTTTTGTISTHILSNATTTYNVTIWGVTDYFNRTYNNQNVSSASLQAELHQAEVCFNTTEYISNASVPADNYTIDSTVMTRCFNISVGTYNVTFQRTGYFNHTQEFNISALENRTDNITGVHTANLTIFAVDALTGSNINSFTINVVSLNHTGWVGETRNTTMQNVTFGLINGTYNLTITSGTHTTQNATITINATSQNYTFTLHQSNTINITIYKESTNDILTGINLTIDLLYANGTSNLTTSNGTLYVYGVAPGEVEIRYSDSGSTYTGRIYILTLNVSSHADIRIYLLNASLSDFITLDLVDQDGQDIEGAIIKTQRQYPAENLFRTVAMTRTNFNGQGSIDLVKKTTQANVFYRFIVEVNGVVRQSTDPLEINPVLQDILFFTIDLQEDVFTSWDFINSLSGDLTFNNTLNQFSFVWSDTTGMVREGCLNVRRRRPNMEMEICDTCVASTSATIICNVTDTGDIYYATAAIDTTTNNSWYTVATLSYSFFNRYQTVGTYGVFLAMLFILTMAMVGVWNPIVSVAMTCVALIFSVAIGFVYLSYTSIISLVIVGGIIIAKSRT